MEGYWFPPEKEGVFTYPPVNLFMNIVVEADGALSSPPNPVKPGAFVELVAKMDLICVVSACPYDLFIEGWPINLRKRGPQKSLWN